MKPLIIILLVLLFSISTSAQKVWPSSLILVPEKTNFEETSTYADVMKFLNDISLHSKEVVVTSMGKSHEGKDIPLAVLSREKHITPERANETNKLIVYIQGNIHAGEVEGKEVLMMFMRDILLGDKNYLLDNMVLLFAPIYNTDSNDKIDIGTRPSQENSPLKAGIRVNSQGLDLNRDGIKIEANETKALFNTVINRWDPQLFVDLHTTNGTWHAYSLTWAPSYAYAGEHGTSEYTVNTMLASITKNVFDKYGLRFGPYGNYSLRDGWPIKNFYTYNHHPRYLINQFGLRNRMAILSEAFAHERFYQRIHATYVFVDEILHFAHANGNTIKSINQQAEHNAIENVVKNAGKAKKGIRYRMISKEKINDFITYDYIATKDSTDKITYFRSGNIVTLKDVNYFGQFEATLESTIPQGYIIPAAFSDIAEHLMRMGVHVEKLTQAIHVKGEQFVVSSITQATNVFEGHHMTTVEGQYKSATKKFNKGDYRIRMDQPLTNLIFYTLEPQSDDGFVTWNFFDTYLRDKKNKSIYPIFKYYP
jgi:hypothetical protein